MQCPKARGLYLHENLLEPADCICVAALLHKGDTLTIYLKKGVVVIKLILTTRHLLHETDVQ